MRASFKTRIRRLLLANVLMLPAIATSSAIAATVTGNVAAWVPTAKSLGAAPDGRSVSIVVHMALKDLDGLRTLTAAVSTPGSGSYGRYLSTSAFMARFAPDRADVATVQTLLGEAGFSSIRVGPMGTYISAVATVGQIRRAFGVSQDTYRYGDATLRANRELPRIPDALAGKIASIEGLDDTTFLKRPQHVSAMTGPLVAPASAARDPAAAPGVLAPPVAAGLPSPYCSTYFGDANATLSTAPAPYGKTLPWLNCGYTPKQIQSAYGLNPKPGIDGTGITVAIIDAYAAPTLQQDGNRYSTRHGLPPLTNANFSQIIPDGIYNVSADEPCGPYGWWGEESLDVDAVHGSAPGAKILYVGSRDCGTSLSTALADTIYKHRADIVTNSYGYNGESTSAADIAMQDQVFMAAAVQGITVLFSSGDDGDLSQANGVATGSFEATSPYVTGVGGTSLGLFNAKGDKVEYGWGNYRDYLGAATVNGKTSITTSGLVTTTAYGETFPDFAFYAGSGGGISLVEPQPGYQASVVPATLATTLYDASGYSVALSPRRVSPDVSAVADPYTGYLVGESFTIAGDAVADSGCTKVSATTEYCEAPSGGTSLASPLIAGVIATLDQIKSLRARPLVGFANPALYSLKIGKTTNSAGINQITAPRSPTALLRGYANDLTRVRVVTINSVPLLVNSTPFPIQVCGDAICEGINDVFNYVTPGYNNVTGLGVPYLPKLAAE